jgi:type IV pilus assembly protein PilW
MPWKNAYLVAASKSKGQPMTHVALCAHRAPAYPGRIVSAGFSLVEVLVAMVIGLIGLIVMMQMFSVFEAQKRTTSSGDDALSGGAVSLYGIQRDMQQSGWGISSLELIGCSVSGLLAGGANLPMVPVTINSAAITGQDANTDTLLIVSGNGNGNVEGDLIDSLPGGNAFAVHTPKAFYVNDRVVAAPKARTDPCNLASTNVTAVASPNVSVGAVAAGIGTGDLLFSLGATPAVRAYAVRNQNLTVCDYRVNNCGSAGNNGNSAIWVPIANNVVSLRAQYGRDSALVQMDAIADVWDQTVPTTATPISSTGAKNTPACALARILAVRIALVARSSQPEKQLAGGAHVTAAVPPWAGSDPVAVAADATEAAAVAFSFPSPDPTWPTWQDFRYKIFQTVVPLRNITTMGVREQC